jgi:hypothetical protein
MTGEEALTLGMTFTSQIFDALRNKLGNDVITRAAENLVCRLQLAEKRKLRKWAACTQMPEPLKDALRLNDLPRRVWVFELHTLSNYGSHGVASAATLVGIVLIDPTGDALDASVLLAHINLPAIVAGAPQGVLVDISSSAPGATQTNDTGPIHPLRS